jgi:hypothetical protein
MSLSAQKKLAGASANWRQKHPLSRMPRMGGNWLGQGHEQGKPELGNMDSQQPRFQLDETPAEAVHNLGLGT